MLWIYNFELKFQNQVFKGYNNIVDAVASAFLSLIWQLKQIKCDFFLGVCSNVLFLKFHSFDRGKIENILSFANFLIKEDCEKRSTCAEWQTKLLWI